MNLTPEEQDSAATEGRKIAINGFQQVIEMLRIADPAFRESLLRRLAVQDSKLALSLRRELKNLEA